MMKNYTGISVYLMWVAAAMSMFSGHALASVESKKLKENHRLMTGEFDLVLVGGGLKTCSSFSLKQCKKNTFAKNDKTELLLKISKDSSVKFSEIQNFWPGNDKEKSFIRQFLVNKYSTYSEKIFTKSLFWDEFKETSLAGVNGNDIYDGMSDASYYGLMDVLEFAEDEQGNRRREQVDLEQNLNQDSLNIYKSFVTQALIKAKKKGRATPRVGVVTASSRDTFEAVDFYVSVFEEAGANTQWVPIDRHVQKALSASAYGVDGCSRLEQYRREEGIFYRELVYPHRAKLQQSLCNSPEKLAELISNLDGLFFNGGDQSLTLASLQDNHSTDNLILSEIKKQLARKLLVVGGTSAGTAVQSGGSFFGNPNAMISNGNSASAIKAGALAVPAPNEDCLRMNTCLPGVSSNSLTYKGDGGTGLFRFGVMDTHFSERDREARLATLVTQTGAGFGFGVDEATALMVADMDTQVNFKVIGQGGVWIVENKDSHFRKQGNKALGLEVSTHFLAEGDAALLSKNSGMLRVNFINQQLEIVPSAKYKTSASWRNYLTKNCSALSSAHLKLEGYQLKVNSQYVPPKVAKVSSSSPWCRYSGLRVQMVVNP